MRQLYLGAVYKVSGTRDTLPSETTLSWIFYDKMMKTQHGEILVFILLHMPKSEKLPLGPRQTVYGQVLSPPPGLPSFVNKVTLPPV